MLSKKLLTILAAFVVAPSQSLAIQPDLNFPRPFQLSPGPHLRHWTPPGAKDFNSSALVASVASWYGPGFHGRLTANGEVYNAWAMTAAHPSLPFGTLVRVTNRNNGRAVVVRINDRGPFYGGRAIDLSQAAAAAVGMTATGVAPVSIQVLR